MKPKVYKPECPPHLVKKAEEEHQAWLGRHYHNRWPDIIWQEEKDGLLYTYIYDGTEACDQGIQTPKYLIAADMEKKRWDTWSFRDEKWSGKMLKNTIGYYGAVEECIDGERYGVTLRGMQGGVRAEEAARRREKRRRRISEDMGQAEELPPAFLAWAERQMDPYLVHNPGDRNHGYCTRCGKEHIFTKELENHIKRTCPSCRACCVVKTPKTLPEMIMGTAVYIQEIKDGVMVRYVTLYKRMKEGYLTAVPDVEEKARVVIKRGERQKWYERKDTSWHDGTEEEMWQQNRTEAWTRGINSPYRDREKYHGCLAVRNKYREDLFHKGIPVYRKNLPRIIKGSILGYMPDWKELLWDMKNENRWERAADAFIDLYDWIHRYPQTESLWKLGFRKLAKDTIKKPSEVKQGQKELHKYLGISKEMWRFLQKEGKEEADCQMLQKIRHYDKTCADKKLVWEAAKRISRHYIDVFRGLPLRKVTAYLKNNEEYLYGDYIRMARNIGYNLNDEFTAFPKNLRQAHDAAVEVQNEIREKEKMEKARKEDPGIRKVYRKIRRKYSFETENFLFRPAASNYEIVKEGQCLHHCVGNGGYARKMVEGDSYIIFMRKKEQPEEPYYTLEVSPDGEIRQAYGKYDKKPDWETAGPAIQQYSEKVRGQACQKASCRKTETNATAVGQTA